MITRVKFGSCSRGSAAVEMALVLPFLILLLFGSIELGYYFYNQHQVVKGLRDGARYASRQPFTSIGCPGGTPVTNAAALTAVRELTRTGQLSGGQPRVRGWEASDITITVNCLTGTLSESGLYRNEGNAPRILITTTVDYTPLFGGLGVVTSQFTLNAKQEAVGMGI